MYKYTYKLRDCNLQVSLLSHLQHEGISENEYIVNNCKFLKILLTYTNLGFLIINYDGVVLRILKKTFSTVSTNGKWISQESLWFSCMHTAIIMEQTMNFGKRMNFTFIIEQLWFLFNLFIIYISNSTVFEENSTASHNIY